MSLLSLNSVSDIMSRTSSIGDNVNNLWNDGSEFIKNLKNTGEHRIQEPQMISYPSGVNIESDDHTWISIITTKAGILKRNANLKVNDLSGTSSSNTTYGLSLPFPQSVQLSDNYSWSGEELGIADVLTKGSFSEGMKAAGSQAKALIKQKGAQAIGSLTGMNVEGAENIVNQHIRNMNIRAMFKNVQFRQFALSFDFAPKSEKEVKDTIQIIREVRAHAAPDNANGYFTYPGYFKVKIQSGEMTLIDYGDCAATSVAVNYTPDGIWSTFRSGFPVHVTLDIGFMETSVATRSLILAGKK